MDDNNSMSLDKYEFTKAMTEFSLGFTQDEIATMYQYFDMNGDGLIQYDEFLRTIRGPINNFRTSFVLKAFAIMDKDGNGVLELKDIQGVYSAKKHPDVI